MVRKTVKPVVIASNNGNIYKNGGDVTGVAKAFNLMIGGSDVLDALVAGVNLCELDPLDTSVGFGGLPNADGVVQLDSSCMHGPKKRAGGVACLEGVKTPSLVAKAVMENTTTICWSAAGRRNSPATWGSDRDRPEHGAIAEALARVEAAGRSGSLPRSHQAVGRVLRRRAADGARRPDRVRSLLGHDQL